MNILSGLFILAAGDDGGRDYSWIVPVVFAAIWIIAKFGSGIVAANESRKEKQKERSGTDDSQMRYKPIPDGSAPQRRERAVSQTASVERRNTMPAAGRVKSEPKHQGTIASLKKAMHDAMEDAQMQQAKRQAPKQAVRRPKEVQHATTRKVSTKRKPVAKESVREVEVMSQEGSVLLELLERENIRKAIIYSEILGKPLAMRDS